MCGIIGGTNLTEKDLIEGLKTLEHRGCNSHGYFLSQKVSLGANRLAIIDLSKQAKQPFRSLQQNRNVWLVYNGEIWNYLNLKRDLITRGYRFFSKSDTEVLMNAYLEWGINVLKKIDGMFAFAIYDADKDVITVARDWVGKIPLHYVYKNTNLYFGSEIKALINIKNIAYDDIRIFSPAHYLIFELKTRKIKFSNYYTLPSHNINVSFKKAAQRVRELLIEGVEKRLISDVPVCALLSGGIDSLLITYILKKYYPTLEAYVVSYDNCGSYEGDLYYAIKAAKWLGIKLKKVFIKREDITKFLPEIIHGLELYKYYQVYAATANYFLAKSIQKKGYKVAFSGEGSDELWGSYDTTREKAGLPCFKETRKYLIENMHRGNLNRVNKVMMYAGTIETRLPFLHRPLVEYCLNLPENYITKDGNRKYLLKEAFKNDIPAEFLDRPKITIQDGSGVSIFFKRFILKSKYNKNNYLDDQLIYRDIFNRLFVNNTNV
jgi:asparagine synthase (glutamine-hydrolysing)